MKERVYRALFPFCGLGAGALGFLQAQADLCGVRVRFESVGGIDNDPASCADFETLTKSPALLADVSKLTPDELRAFAGEKAPDVVFGSPPCKGYSGLLGEKRSKTEKYQQLNRLVLDWVELVLAAWPDAPPRLLLLENVPRIATRGAGLLRKVRSLLHAAGYVSHGTSHDCGELGGLAQHRRRFLLVARHTGRVPSLLYQPVKRRVRGCGEVLGELPLPNDPAAGPLHRLPSISWLNWVRLALIPPGGDWRDLPTGERLSQGANCHNNKYVVLGWDDPSRTVIGATRPGSGAPAVADPRVGGVRHNNVFNVHGWDAPVGAVNGGAGPSSGAASVADPRVGNAYPSTYGVLDWHEPAHTVTGNSSTPGGGPNSVADPRVRTAFAGGYGLAAWGAPAGTVTGEAAVSTGTFAVGDPRITAFHSVYGVAAWDAPMGTVTGGARSTTGTFSVADPRLGPGDGVTWYKGKHGVLDWADPSRTVIGGPSNGADAIADPRLGCAPWATSRAYGVLGWSEPSPVVSGSLQVDNGAAAVADPRIPGNPALAVRWYPRDLKSSPPFVPVLPTADGTWHRPLTTLELAALQGLPTTVDGKPLELHGVNQSAWRERIGNAVPPPAAAAIARQMLLTLAQSDAEAWSLALSNGGAVWVEPGESAVVELGGTA